MTDGSHWWSDALNDPWRDPNTTVTLSVPPADDPVRPEPYVPRESGRVWWLAGMIGLISAVLAGAAGGVVGARLAADDADTVKGAIGTAVAVPRPAPESLASVARTVLPSVVTIRIAVDGGTALGSGFVASEKGHVITNDHVVAGGSGPATVVFGDGSTAQAELVGADLESDVAVLQVRHKPGLTVAQLGDSDHVSVGDQVMAIGSPLALHGTVTAGIVSAVDRPITTGSGRGGTRYYAAIQTDAAVNHGNSGGPLVDSAGQVVGINAVIKSLAVDEQSAGNIGLAFAIPINHAQRVANEIITAGKAKRTVIGAELDDATRTSPGGVKIREVFETGPAANAGLRPGDMLTTFNGKPVAEPADLIALVRKTAPGKVVPVAYKRGSSSHNVDVTLAADPE